jgi:extradiol dioxygenase family protein
MTIAKILHSAISINKINKTKPVSQGEKQMGIPHGRRQQRRTVLIFYRRQMKHSTVDE